MKKPVKKVVIVYRPKTKDALKKANELAEWLTERKIKVYSHPEQRLGRRNQDPYPALKTLTTTDLVIVLGGDGTYLYAVRMLKGKKVPILGINMGSLGFLTETRVDEMYEAIEATFDGQMEMRPRTMLQVKVRRKGKIISEHTALNDVVLERGPESHLINLDIYCGELFVGPLKADGLIISSPTGSTAYNLAAGGPILHPEVKSLVVTPICPHSLTSRPMIFPEEGQLRFKLNDSIKRVVLTIDGQNCGKVSMEDEVLIYKSRCDHFVLRKPSHNYFSLLREKLKFGERA